MSQDTGPKQGGSNRLNVDLGERLAADVEILRRRIQDSLPVRQRVSLGDVVRLALDSLHLAYLKAKSAESSLSREEATLYSLLVDEMTTNPTAPPWLVDLYSSNGHPALSSGKPGEVAKAGRKREKPKN